MSSFPTAGVDYISDAITPVHFIVEHVFEQCVYISVVNDTILEFDEYFTVHLKTTDGDVKFLTKYASIDILDDDCKY